MPFTQDVNLETTTILEILAKFIQKMQQELRKPLMVRLGSFDYNLALSIKSLLF